MPAPAYPPAPPGGFSAISKYNPHLWTPAQLRAIFVARQRELADLTQTLRDLPTGTVGQHCLLVGARGMGKSTLMQRLALAVEDDASLSATWLPLRFPEEQYTVHTLAQFWANVLDSLADALERHGQPAEAIAAIDATATRLAALPPAEQAEAALQALRHISQTQDQRLLLLVDNTDLLLHNIGPQAQWVLRQVLQSEPRLLWVGGSYQSLEANSQYHDAFLDFFRITELRPLSLDEMRQALLALAHTFGGEASQAQMQHQLQAQPERLPTLRLLSGGNPRTTVMLYELLASGHAGHVRSDLEALLDNMTPLYKARLDALADLPRKLLAHILGHWAPMSLGQLAQASQIPKTSISPQLQRLELEGLIEKTRLHGTTRSGYQAAERFFNIWYLMRLAPRRQRTRLGWLVEFMRMWFSQDELCALARSRLSSTRDPGSAHELDNDSALADALPANAPEKHSLRWNLLKQLQTQREALSQIFELDGVDQDFKGADDYLRRARALPALLRQCPHATTDEDKQRWVDAVMGSLGLSLGNKKKIATDAQTISQTNYEKLLALLTKNSTEWVSMFGKTAFADMRRAVLNLDFFPDMPDSRLAFEQIRYCFGNHPEALLAAANRHYASPHEDEWTLKSLELAQEKAPTNAHIAYQRAWLLHNKLGRYAEAEAAYRQVIALDEKDAAPWNNLGNILQDHLGRYAEAEAAYHQAIALDEKNAFPWNGLATLLQNHLGRYEEAEAAYRQVIALDEKYAFPWNGLGNLLQTHLGRYAEAEAAYRQAIALDEKNAFPWNGLGSLLQDHLGRYAEAEAAYRQAIALDEKNAIPWNGLGTLLQNHLGRYEEAETAYRKAIALDEKFAPPWAGLGTLLQDHLGHYAEAEAAYRQAIALDEEYAAPWNNLGTLLQDQLDRNKEAEGAYRQAIALDKNDPYPLTNLALQLWTQNRLPEAKDLFSQAASLANKQQAHHLQIQAHLCLNNQQLALQALDALAAQAQQGNAMANFRLREQVWETHQLGLAERLADWMQQSPHALYLQPFVQALYTLSGADTKLQDLPEEVQCASDAVVAAARQQLAKRINHQPLASVCLPPAT